MNSLTSYGQQAMVYYDYMDTCNKQGSCVIEWSGVFFYKNTVELQWLEQLLNRRNMFETGVVRAFEC